MTDKNSHNKKKTSHWERNRFSISSQIALPCNKQICKKICFLTTEFCRAFSNLSCCRQKF